MKRIFILITVVLSVLFTGCIEESSTSVENRKQEELSRMAIESVGLPNIANFYEKKTLKKILEMRDNPKTINYFYTKNNMTGKWVYEGKCIGFGIPYTTQYTNPNKIHDSYSSGGYAVFNQADPNGLYSMPSGTATWVIKVDDNGKQTVEYIESEIRVVQTKLNKRLVEAWSIDENY